MKILKKAGILAMACILGLSSLAACGNKDEVSSDPNTLNVRLFKGGYGTSWVYELASAFEELYAEENYKINIINPSSDMRGNVAIQEMALGYKDKGIDLYITGDIRPDKVGELGDYGVLVEEISDLYEMTPVSFDGTEENVKIKDKIYSQLFQNMADSNGKIYAYPYMNCAAGVVVNTKKLKKYGFTEFPKTTNEWFDMIDNIYCGCNGQENSEKTKVFPITYVPGNTNGYTLSMVSLLMLQYDEDQFNEFASMQKKDENGNYVDMKDDGYEVYNNECVLEMLNVCYRLFDNKIASYGTASQGLDQAQAQIMKDGGAVFMCNGDWMLNEVALNYKNYLNDIEYMNYPVVSALGTKLWGDKYSAEDCEKILSYVIGNMLLGFGVKNIGYFTYFRHDDNSSEFFDQDGSFINDFGEKTDLYYIMQDIMEKNQSFAHVIFNFEYVTSATYNVDSDFKDNFSRYAHQGEFAKITKAENDKVNMLITELYDDDNSRYMYMIQNICDSQYQGSKTYQTSKITFSEEYNYAVIYENAERSLVKLDNHTLTVENKAGSAKFVIPY